MSLLPKVFNADQHGGMGFDPVPDDRYKASIIKSEIKPTKAGDGKRLNFQLKIIEGEMAKRIVFVGLNIVNKNATTVEIANKELADICRACGKLVVEDTQDLHNIPIWITTGIETSDDYPDKNIVKKYEIVEGQVASGASPFDQQ